MGKSTPASTAGLETYEQRLDNNSEWALMEGSKHFGESSNVFEALRTITAKLTELGIDYAVVGGLALFHHGYRRFTEDVDLLVTKSDLQKIHNELSGLGYLPPHQNSKHLRDTQHGVRIEFLTTGDFPGDGKPKPISFPAPSVVSEEAGGVHYLTLPALIELKLASGMSNLGRMKDLTDVLELIKSANLEKDFAEQLDPYVAQKYVELWQASQENDFHGQGEAT